jgi:ACS family hexuronate transporter-like MFS transporter
MPQTQISRRRWFILAIIFAAVVLNYFDRQIVSILKPTLKETFTIDDSGYALVVNVFTACYAAMYPLAGWLADRFGARMLMLVGVAGWSVACLGTGLSTTFRQLALFRGALGLFEPMAFPAQLRVVTTWFPGTLRGTANSLCVAGSSIGAIMAPPLVAWITLRYGWHASFIIPGSIGLAVAALWLLVYRDPPRGALEATSERVSADRRAAFAWPQLWKTRSLWGILLCRFVSDPVWYFCLFWLPGYLQEHSGLTLEQTGMVGWIPFLAADLGGVGSAAWSDYMVKRGVTPLRARKVMLTTVAALAPICVLTPHLPHPAAVLFLFSIVGAVCLSWLFSLSVVIAETFPAENVGSVLGIAGGCGAAGAVVFNTYVGGMMDTIGPAPIFAVMALLHPLASVVLWTMVRPERPNAPHE